MGLRLADVARQADVSEATVSRVINGKPGVAESTRQAVLAALDVLGYDRPIRLRRKIAGLVGLIVPELENPVFPAFAEAIESALARHGYTLILCTQTPGGVHEDDYVEMLLERGVAGIVFVCGLHADTDIDHGRYQRLRERGLPIVLVNGYASDIDALFVSTDDRLAMDLAVSHVAQLGHTDIGLVVGQRRFVPAARKAEGFEQAVLRRLGVPVAPDAVAEALFTVEGGALAAQRLVDRGATALLCASDLMALGAIRAVRQWGLDVPGDVSVVGFDDSPLMAFTDPPLTTLRQRVDAMSVAVVSALLHEIGGQRNDRSELLFTPELVVRGSTGAAPTR